MGGIYWKESLVSNERMIGSVCWGRDSGGRKEPGTMTTILIGQQYSRKGGGLFYVYR